MDGNHEVPVVVGDLGLEEIDWPKQFAMKFATENKLVI